MAPEVRVGDTDFNYRQILKAMEKADDDAVDCIVFPELSVTGYTCADLFEQERLLRNAEATVKKLCDDSEPFDFLMAVGCPVRALGRLYNCAIIIASGRILGIVPKIHIPNYGEFYEKRWFESGKGVTGKEIWFAGMEVAFGSDLLFRHQRSLIGVEICEDLWVPEPPSGKMAMAGAEVILNLSASDELIGKQDYIVSLIGQQSARCRCCYAYASAGWGESSTDLVFSGKAMIGYDGSVTGSEKRFETGKVAVTADVDIDKLRMDRMKYSTFFDDADYRKDYRIINSSAQEYADIEITNFEEGDELFGIDFEKYDYRELQVVPDPYPFVPHDSKRLRERCEEIINIQAYGLMRRLEAIGCRKAVVGISGGLDSTLALLVTVRAFDRLKLPREGIVAITMPGMATTSRTKNNAMSLMEELGVSSAEIAIGEAVSLHFRDIAQDPEKYDATYENSQARERTQILMDVANKEGGIVIGTGDMSELALGWCTYNGDQMSMYGVNAGVPKTLVRHLVKWFASKEKGEVAKILEDIVDTPISPELVPSGKDEISQKTEDLVGPYELHDFYLYNMLRNGFEPTKIFRLACKAFEKLYDEATIKKWLKVFYRRFFSQQFKRSCMPDGPKVGSVSLSPRGDWRMPSDASAKIWLDEVEKL
ncbi:MAG: NAD(+) synthase [Muribaculaceae bacterium]|nr:NAD(+) synthase [Muribaculaceae bacterium]